MVFPHYLHTGQTTCYADDGRPINCQGSGQDAAFNLGLSFPQPRFELVKDQVLDRLTGLIWSRNANLPNYPLTWQEALDFVTSMNREKVFGQTDWRLPNRRELLSLLSMQTTRPSLPERHPFVNVFNDWYWTSTTAAIDTTHAWYASFEGARLSYGDKKHSFMLWPVRGQGQDILPRTGQTLCYNSAGKVIDAEHSGQDGEHCYGVSWPEPRFEMFAAGVLDRLTGLLWRRQAKLTPQPVHWHEALAAVVKLNTADRSIVWRLPTINELESLVDCATHSPALPNSHPFADVQETYWSSTTSLFATDWAWSLDSQTGASGVGQKQFALFSVWAVATASGALT